ncbi:hypothetical protein HPB52_004012 [Rhipicephalus sanguineus]|uniref:Uncharacterized protein n=1 Tax=Rhipicephalus sanguineus TaxID=34632 RepID=A0A9D4SQN8_RHISA|nr:hypothetical protein HPB52_004012 [Rhipicephalus sanguineus]
MDDHHPNETAGPSRMRTDETKTDPSTCGAENTLQRPAHSKLLLEPPIRDIWEQLAVDIVDKKAWKVDSFDSLTSLDAYSEDVRHFPAEDERIRMKKRRDAALRLRSSPERWSRLALDALRELATDSSGPAVATLVESGLLAVFKDFAVHTRYFQVTKKLMESAGITVFVAGHASSSTHDIDKLDPIMLAGYTDRWEDTKRTALWYLCVHSHYSLNTHHQQHELWHAEDSDDKERERCKALPELLCDKASRKLQKELNGVVSPDMWSVEAKFYLGMPEVWLDRVTRMARQLAERTPSGESNVTVT